MEFMQVYTYVLLSPLVRTEAEKTLLFRYPEHPPRSKKDQL